MHEREKKPTNQMKDNVLHQRKSIVLKHARIKGSFNTRATHIIGRYQHTQTQLGKRHRNTARIENPHRVQKIPQVFMEHSTQIKRKVSVWNSPHMVKMQIKDQE